MGKGSGRRPGDGYESNWDRIFGGLEDIPAHTRSEPQKPSYEDLERRVKDLQEEIRRLQQIISERM